MGNAVFPDLPGLSILVTKSPEWSTRSQKSVSGKQLRAANYSYPIWHFSLAVDVLRAGVEGELQTLMGFFNSRNGGFDSFLFTDPEDYAVVGQQIGTGNSVTTQFQLLRTMGGFVEPIKNVNGAPSIYIDTGSGPVLKTAGTDYTISSTGLVTFAVAPASGALITWTGSFYFRVHFKQDIADFERFLYQLWQLKKIELESDK